MEWGDPFPEALMEIKHFFDPRTWTLTYLVWDPETRDALVIDPVTDFDPLRYRLSTESVDDVSRFIEVNDLRLLWILETHAHADHVSGAPALKARFGAKVAIGANITVVQETFGALFNLGPEFTPDGSQFDRLLQDGELFEVGSLRVRVIFTPGHTPACASYQIGDAVFTGDALFMPDSGTGRCDFPRGSAEDLYNSVCTRLYTLPDETRLFVGHDYQPGGRELRFRTTVGESKAHNKQLTANTSRETFVFFRKERDATLDPPKLLFPSIQLNINAGELPKAEANGMSYLKYPLNLLK